MRSFKLPGHLKYLLIILVSGLAVFSFFRLALLITNLNQLDPHSRGYLAYAFLNRGLLFDLVTSCYILALPFLALSLPFLYGKTHKGLIKVVNIWIIALYILTFGIGLADIPFFKYYNARISKAVFSWTDDPAMMVKVTFTDYHYWPWLLVFAALVAAWIAWIARNGKKFAATPVQHRFVSRILIFFITSFMMFIGLRGEYHLNFRPILIEHAFKTPYSFVNQLGLNGTFHFFHSLGDFEVHFMDDEKALSIVRKELNITQQGTSPIARIVRADVREDAPNVVLVLVESLSAAKIGRFHEGPSLTPNLDSLSRLGLCFDSVYSAGEHTYNGVFSTLYGFPALMNIKPTTSSASSAVKYSGLPTILAKAGYHNVFFCPNDKQFDNLSGFLPANGFHKIFDENDYPESTIVNGWGVSDHYQYDRVLKYCDSLASGHQKFLATVLTIATHSPYTLPKNIPFKARSTDVVDQSYEYADWAIGRFMKMAATKSWYKHTVFVFIGDHGQNFDATYDLPLSYHHTPLLILDPGHPEPETSGALGLQIDVFPTLMGILQIPYENHTLGIDLRIESRPFAYFTADNKIGCLNHQHFLVIHKDGRESLYAYRNRDLKDYLSQQPELVARMKNYVYPMLQTTQYLIRKNQVK